MNISSGPALKTTDFTHILDLYNQNIQKRAKRHWLYIVSTTIIITIIIICFVIYIPSKASNFDFEAPPVAMAVDLVTMPENFVSNPIDTPTKQDKTITEPVQPQDTYPQISTPLSHQHPPDSLPKKRVKPRSLPPQKTIKSQLPKKLLKQQENKKVQEKPSESPSASSIATSPTHEHQPPDKGSSPHSFHDATSWQTALLAHLEKFKRYPAPAMEENQEGVPIVRFSIDRQGNVLHTKLVKSSDYPLLDEEALSLPERAQPLPPPPDTIKGEIITLTVPVEFSVRHN